MANQIQIKRGLSTNIATLVLLSGELAYTTDTGKLYVGKDGTVNKTLVNGTVNVSDIAGLGTAATANTGTTAGNVPVLNASGKLDNSIIPAIAITDIFVVNSQAAMLALSAAEVGDIAIRTDINQSFILQASPSSVIGNWQQLLAPLNTVQSINGKTGIVVIGIADILMTGYTMAATASSILATDTLGVAIGKIEKSDSLKAPLISPALSGTPTAPTAVAGTNTTQIATTQFVVTSYAPLASPTITGTPVVPTATVGTNTTQIASTAFVNASILGATIDGGTF